MKKAIIYFIISIFFISVTNAQWKLTNGTSKGETVACITVSGNNVFVGTMGGGIFLSTNDGTGWSPINSGLPKSPMVMAIAVMGPNIIAGTTEDGIFLSRNNGKSWSEIRKGFKSYQVNAFAVIGKNIFVGTYDGVFLSTDNGESWKPVSLGLKTHDVRSLTANGNNLFAGTKNGGLYLSNNNGEFWQPVNNGLTDSTITTLASIGSNVFAGTFSSGVFLSTNNGTSWLAVNTGLKDTLSTLAYDNIRDTLISLLGKGRVNSKGPGIHVHSFAVSDGNIFVSSGRGIFLSNNNGASWTDVSSGMKDIAVSSLTINKNFIFAGTFSEGVWRRPLSDILTIH